MNKLYIVGRFTADPEIREVQVKDETRALVKFTVAVPGRQKDDPADFFHCTAWGGAAELIGKYCRKGDKLALCGSIRLYTYTDKDGCRVNAHEVNVETFDFMSRSPSDTKPTSQYRRKR